MTRSTFSQSEGVGLRCQSFRSSRHGAPDCGLHSHGIGSLGMGWHTMASLESQKRDPKTLIQCSTWPSDAIKYEAICLVIKYWSDEPVPERPDTRSSQRSSVQREATQSVQRGARPVETDNKRRILVELHDILPEIPHFDPPVMVGHFLDLPCEEGTTSEDA